MSDQLEVPELADEQWTEELPPRPRRRLLTPLTGGLLALLVAAGGFIGGVLVEKGQSSGTSPSFASAAARFAGAASQANGSGGRRGFGALFGGGGRPGGDGGRQLTAGQVSSLEGRTLYVKTAQGNTVRVHVPAGESVSRTVTTGVHAIHPGDSVIVQGTSGRGGTITATSVRATEATGGGSSAAGLLNQLFGAGGTQSSGAGGNG